MGHGLLRKLSNAFIILFIVPLIIVLGIVDAIVEFFSDTPPDEKTDEYYVYEEL